MYQGDYQLGQVVRIKFTTTAKTSGAPVAPSSAFAASDFRIYKDGSATEKTSTNGITVTSPFDSVTGRHLVEIDTNNNTGDTGFWAAGSDYWVELNTAKTVDSESVSGLAVGGFSLDNRNANANVSRVKGDSLAAEGLEDIGRKMADDGVFPIGSINAAAIAANALNGKGNWLTTLGTNAPAGWINAAAIAASALNGKGDWATAADVSTPIINPTFTFQAEPDCLNELRAKIGENKTQVITVFAADGVTPIDVEALGISLEFVIDGPTGTQLAHVTNGSITQNENVISVPVPASGHPSAQDGSWSLRNSATKLEIVGGPYRILYSPLAD